MSISNGQASGTDIVKEGDVKHLSEESFVKTIRSDESQAWFLTTDCCAPNIPLHVIESGRGRQWIEIIIQGRARGRTSIYQSDKPLLHI